MGVLHRIIFFHTPDEAMSGGLVKACAPGKIVLFQRKSEFLIVYADIQVFLEKLSPNPGDMTFEEFLAKVGISETVCILPYGVLYIKQRFSSNAMSRT